MKRLLLLLATMVMAQPLHAASLKFTLPVYVDDGACSGADSSQVTRLAAVELWGARCMDLRERLLASKACWGREGQRDSLEFDPAGCAWWCRVRTIGAAGDSSCMSKSVVVWP